VWWNLKDFFIANLVLSERILKIDQYFTNLWDKLGGLFFGLPCATDNWNQYSAHQRRARCEWHFRSWMSACASLHVYKIYRSISGNEARNCAVQDTRIICHSVSHNADTADMHSLLNCKNEDSTLEIPQLVLRNSYLMLELLDGLERVDVTHSIR